VAELTVWLLCSAAYVFAVTCLYAGIWVLQRVVRNDWEEKRAERLDKQRRKMLP